uniref:Uncharacterized protein LOC105073055 isoform X5 n=1 Tax=Camelus bactrianus TaxID=9837 RepID=A0A9W3GCT3_CAMBA|nr:uncharacterized protein LOC105073055 isoform X5 [Camelus bactrianus]
MVLGMCCQRERLYKFLYVVQIFILAGVVYYYFQGSLGKADPDHEIAGGSSQPIGETLRPVWGQMDKCYPVTTQAMTPKTTGGPNDAAPKEETDVLSQDEGEVRSPGEEAASPIPAGQEVAEEEAVSVPPGGEVRKPLPQLGHPSMALTEKPQGAAGWRGHGEGGQWWGVLGHPQDDWAKLLSQWRNSSVWS